MSTPTLSTEERCRLRSKKLVDWQYEAAQIQRFNPALSPETALMLALRSVDTAFSIVLNLDNLSEVYTLHMIFDSVCDHWS